MIKRLMKENTVYRHFTDILIIKFASVLLLSDVNNVLPLYRNIRKIIKFAENVPQRQRP